MQLELVLPLRGHRDHAGVVRPRADLAEPDLVALDEQLDAEEAEPPRSSVTASGDLAARARSAAGAHRVRLPALDVVAADLHVADRLAEVRAAARVARAHGEQRDLVVEVDEALDDHAPLGDAAAGHRVVPGRATSAGPSILLWPLPRAAHHRLDDAGVADAPLPSIAACSSASESQKRYGLVGRRSVSAARRRMPSRSIVSRAARAVGITRTTPAASSSSSTGVAMASISGTTSIGFSASISARSAAGSLIVMVRAWCATWWPGALG
jgi:hypothetical protein